MRGQETYSIKEHYPVRSTSNNEVFSLLRRAAQVSAYDLQVIVVVFPTIKSTPTVGRLPSSSNSFRQYLSNTVVPS